LKAYGPGVLGATWEVLGGPEDEDDKIKKDEDEDDKIEEDEDDKIKQIEDDKIKVPNNKIHSCITHV